MPSRPFAGGRPVGCRTGGRCWAPGCSPSPLPSTLSACGGSGPIWSPQVDFGAPLPIPPLAPVAPRGRRAGVRAARPGGHPRVPARHDARRPGASTAATSARPCEPPTASRCGSRWPTSCPETTTVHWHGMHLPARMDGGPHQPIAPGRPLGAASGGSTRRRPRSGTTLIRTARPRSTSTAAWPGCSSSTPRPGSDAPALPDTYGVDDLPLVIQDKKVDADGQLVFDDGGNEIGAARQRGAGQRGRRRRSTGSPPTGSGCGCSTGRPPAPTRSGWPTGARFGSWPPTEACSRRR